MARSSEEGQGGPSGELGRLVEEERRLEDRLDRRRREAEEMVAEARDEAASEVERYRSLSDREVDELGRLVVAELLERASEREVGT